MKKNVKIRKFFAFLLIGCMMAAMTACGKAEEPDLSALPSHNADGTVKDDRSESSKPADNSQAAAETSKETQESSEASQAEPEKPTVEGEEYTTNFFTCTVPTALHVNEDSSYEGSSYGYYYIENEDASLKIRIDVDTESTKSFRKELIYQEFTMEDYAAGSIPTENFAGYDWVKREYTSWDTPNTVFLSRDTAAGMTLEIFVTGAINEDMQAVLDTLEITLEDKGNVEAPYPWEGAPFIAECGSAAAGSYTVSAVQMVMNESFLPSGIFDNRVCIVDNLAYVLSRETLNVYTINGTNLTLTHSYDLEDEYGYMNADDMGYVYVTDFMNDMLMFKDGELWAVYEEIDDRTFVSPSGYDALTFFMDPEKVELYTYEEDGWVSQGTFSFCGAECKSVSTIFITENYIIVAGSAADESGHKVFVYDYDGNYVMTLEDDDGTGLGFISGICEGDDFFIAVDGNMREVILWDKATGAYIEDIDDGVLFGTDYPWMGDLSKGADGNFYVSMAEERPDGSWDEIVVYQISVR